MTHIYLKKNEIFLGEKYPRKKNYYSSRRKVGHFKKVIPVPKVIPPYTLRFTLNIIYIPLSIIYITLSIIYITLSIINITLSIINITLSITFCLFTLKVNIDRLGFAKMFGKSA